MSGLCIVNLKEHNLGFENMNKLAKSLVCISLKNEVAVFFHSPYREDIIKKAGMKNYFVMSDSFLYWNCNFLDLETLVIELLGGSLYGEIKHEDQIFRDAFFKKYKFFDFIIDQIFQYDVQSIEIFISENGMVNEISDFEEIFTTRGSFLSDLYDSLIDFGNDFNYEFPNALIYISKN